MTLVSVVGFKLPGLTHSASALSESGVSQRTVSVHKLAGVTVDDKDIVKMASGCLLAFGVNQ